MKSVSPCPVFCDAIGFQRSSSCRRKSNAGLSARRSKRSGRSAGSRHGIGHVSGETADFPAALMQSAIIERLPFHDVEAAIGLAKPAVELLANQRGLTFHFDFFQRGGGEDRIARVFSELLGLEILRLSQPFVAIGVKRGKDRRQLSGFASRLALMPRKPSFTKSSATFDQSAVRKASISRVTSMSQMEWRATSVSGKGFLNGSRMI